MAKIKPGNLAPYAYPRIRGLFLTQDYKGGIAARTWPKKRGKNQSPNSQWTSQQWGIAARWSASMFPLDYLTAQAVTAGTDWMPRDILLRAIFGTAIEVYNPDGTKWTVSYKGPPPPRRALVQQWQYDIFDAVNDASTDAGAQAFKGCTFVPSQDMQIAAALARFTPISTAEYKMVVATLNAGFQITALAVSAGINPLGTTRRWYEFNITADLVAGTTYAVMVGRTLGGNTYALPIQISTAQKWQFPMTLGQNARLAQQTPAVGQTVTVAAGNAPPFGLLATY